MLVIAAFVHQGDQNAAPARGMWEAFFSHFDEHVTVPMESPVRSQPALFLETLFGAITIELRPDAAPVSVEHVIRLVREGWMTDTTFYRSQRREHWLPGREFCVLQGGRGFPAEGVPTVEHEAPSLPHIAGAVALARGAPGTASSEFFITLDERAPALEPGAGPPMDGFGFTVFGMVIEGMDVVRAIHALPTDMDAPLPFLKGQFIAEPVPFQVSPAP